jgi:ABC-type lipoprotein release transport system permease subunit
MTTAQWEVRNLKLRPDLVWTMAFSSLRLRIGRSVLTMLTISTSTAFLTYLLTMPAAADASAAAADQQGWKLMMILSLVVSAAGVLNTMLMSVSQRYREIGTMKCLGALDGFILLTVLLEAAILGMLGALLGIALGFIISLLLALGEGGGGAFSRLQLNLWYFKFFGVFLVGMALTTFGASVPAYIAAKMPPMDAMRGEK